MIKFIIGRIVKKLTDYRNSLKKCKINDDRRNILSVVIKALEAK